MILLPALVLIVGRLMVAAGQPAPTCTSSKIDMVLCLDGSYSMGNSYSDVQDVKLLMDKFTISSDKTRVAVRV